MQDVCTYELIIPIVACMHADLRNQNDACKRAFYVCFFMYIACIIVVYSSLPFVSNSSLSVVELDPVNAVRPEHVPGLNGHTYTSPVLFTAEPGPVPFGAPTIALDACVRGMRLV